MRKTTSHLAIYLVFILCLMIVQNSVAQITFEKTYKYGFNSGNHAFDVELTNDGGYIFAGGTVDSVSQDIYVVKLDAYGEVIWERTYGSQTSETAYAIRQTDEGDYVILNQLYLFPGSEGYRIYVIKINNVGDTIWTRLFEEPNGSSAIDMEIDMDGNIIVLGAIYNQSHFPIAIKLIKISPSGDVFWEKSFGDTNFLNSPGDIEITSYGNYVIVGTTGIWFEEEPLIMMINPQGDSLWTKVFSNVIEYTWSIEETYDSGFIIAGGIVGNNYFEVCLFKTDSQGDSVWTKSHQGSFDIYSRDVEETVDSGFVVVGRVYANVADQMFIYRTDNLGNPKWYREMNKEFDDLEGYDIEQTPDGGFIIAGAIAYDGTNNGVAYLLKTNSLGLVSEVENGNYSDYPLNFILGQNYPNPFNPSTKIKYSIPQSTNVVIKVFDILGNEIETLVNEEKQVGAYEITWYAENLPSGVYFYQLKAGSFVETKKMVLLR